VTLRPILFLAIGLLLQACGARAEPEGAVSGPIQIESVAVRLNDADPSVTSVGNFAYAGGVAVSSQGSDHFGGLSDLSLTQDGQITAVTDSGDLLTGQLVVDQGKLAGIDRASLQTLTGLDGQPLTSKRQGDAEGVVRWPNGDQMVSFERDHRIWLYPAAGGVPEVMPKPDIAMDDNDGMEGLSLAPAQGPDAYWVGVEPGTVWLCRLKAVCAEHPNMPKPPAGYRLSALNEAPNGDLVLLFHRWDRVLKTSHVAVQIVRQPASAQPKIVDRLNLSPPLSVDNFEGLWAEGRKGGGLRLYLLTDDNFSKTQRNLFLAFDWTPADPNP
jgi:hypothetical protein